MKKRLILLAGVGVGFVLGSYSGRASYEKLRAQVDQLWSDPRVQEQFEKAGETVREKAPEVAQAVKDKAPEVAAGVQSAAASAVAASKDKFDDLTHGHDDEDDDPQGDDAVDDAPDGADLDADDRPVDDALSADSVDPDIVSDPSTLPEEEGPVGHS
ncbi:hypothetical protein [Brevibacterium yomogidense]|uniref:hypothetical protein n=1 Tax=Brevibacterium yomogidense TaxID=946573 RepID=UPI0018DF9E45|nr:hypothetical protein [Brevibacterium yomogidense]